MFQVPSETLGELHEKTLTRAKTKRIDEDLKGNIKLKKGCQEFSDIIVFWASWALFCDLICVQGLNLVSWGINTFLQTLVISFQMNELRMTIGLIVRVSGSPGGSWIRTKLGFLSKAFRIFLVDLRPRLVVCAGLLTCCSNHGVYSSSSSSFCVFVFMFLKVHHC